MTNHYETLGVEPSATDAEIRAAFKKLAMKLHPDREGGNAEKFQEARRAFDALQNRVCPICEGRGFTRVREGAFTKPVNCPRCWAK